MYYKSIFVRNNLFAIALGVFFVIGSFAQETNTQQYTIADDLKPLRVGVKIGSPNLATLNVEYLTPLLGDRVALSFDYMSLSPTINDVQFDYSNFEIGTNIYFNDTGRGLYGGVSYFSFDSDIILDGETGTLKYNTINLKLGAKAGKKFFFRFELGYGFGDLPEYIDVTDSNGTTTREDISEVNGLLGSGIPVFILGFGFGFL